MIPGPPTLPPIPQSDLDGIRQRYEIDHSGYGFSGLSPALRRWLGREDYSVRSAAAIGLIIGAVGSVFMLIFSWVLTRFV